jgi:hypothetical protein
MRYQEWWLPMFQEEFKTRFKTILTLGKLPSNNLALGQEFAPFTQAIQFEQSQIDEYLSLEIKADDILLLNDLSYPGLFAQMLFHKRPNHCFAICHATAKNRYDYFSKDRNSKYSIEKSVGRLFKKVFVASNYHAQKLSWNNLVVAPFPFQPFQLPEIFIPIEKRIRNIVSISRPGIQKRNYVLEGIVEDSIGLYIDTPKNRNTWDSYNTFLQSSKIVLITSKEETYGYQVIDAVRNGCIPIAPATCSYPELLPKEYLFTDTQDLISKLNKALTGQLSVPELLVEESQKQFFNTVFHEFNNA